MPEPVCIPIFMARNFKSSLLDVSTLTLLAFLISELFEIAAWILLFITFTIAPTPTPTPVAADEKPRAPVMLPLLKLLFATTSRSPVESMVELSITSRFPVEPMVELSTIALIVLLTTSVPIAPWKV